ncbi:unnamed protein product [Phytophthora fragariaefolia]|uniref:Unnamed protein product n=1 Tax=Phytophthora fragariaefolia TaxID=1490495 RepID=A0A9W7CQ27_9STRA|nr:unnamed protein product [Phytophthora fragariaefolia]
MSDPEGSLSVSTVPPSARAPSTQTPLSGSSGSPPAPSPTAVASGVTSSPANALVDPSAACAAAPASPFATVHQSAASGSLLAPASSSTTSPVVSSSPGAPVVPSTASTAATTSLDLDTPVTSLAIAPYCRDCAAGLLPIPVPAVVHASAMGGAPFGTLLPELEQLRNARQSVGTQLASAQASSDVAYQDLSAELQAAQTRIRGLRAELRTAQQSTVTTMSPSYPPLPAATSTPAADSSSSHSAIVPVSSSAGLLVQISNLRHELARAQESERRAREASRMSSDRREQAEQRLLDVERENQRLQAAVSMETIRGDAYKASFDRNVEQRTQDNVEASEVVATLGTFLSSSPVHFQ